MKSVFAKPSAKSSSAKIGLALGGGGARGFAHIPVLQKLDDLGLRPAQISGTSMGAIVGALYASGTSAAGIREIVDGMIIYQDEGPREIFRKSTLWKWFELIDPNFFRKGGVIKGAKIVEFLHELIGVDRFEELQTPLSIVATDYHTGEQVVFDSGPLMPAVRASMSIPGLFEPVIYNGRLLVDGGCVNPVPHDLLNPRDLIIAVDVSDLPQTGKGKVPGVTNALMGAVEIMGRQIGDHRRAASPPDIFLRPQFEGVEMTDFHRAEKIFADAQPICEQLEAELRTRIKLLGA